MHNAMSRQGELLREAVATHDGFIVKTTGDRFHAVFANVHDAGHGCGRRTNCAPRRRLEHHRDGARPMGIHTGEAEVRNGNYAERGDLARAPDVGGAWRPDRRVNRDPSGSRTRCPRSTGSSVSGSTGCATWAGQSGCSEHLHPDLERDFAPFCGRTLDAARREPAVAGEFVRGR